MAVGKPRGFNPTLVRLRLGKLVNVAYGRGGVFQSHAGSIEAPPRKGLQKGDDERFNPTLVRLRLFTTTRMPTPTPTGFNPTLVRLRLELIRVGHVLH